MNHICASQIFNAEILKKKPKDDKEEKDSISKLEQLQDSIKTQGQAWEKLITNLNKLKFKKPK